MTNRVLRCDSKGDLSQVTAWLRRAAAGDESARQRAYALVREELRRIAMRNMSRADRLSLEATMIVDDAYLKLLGQTDVPWKDRSHFYAYASHVVRHLLIDHARTRLSLRRNAGQKPLDLAQTGELAGNTPDPAASLERVDELVRLDAGLKRLERDHAGLAQVVQLHYFGGWSFEQIGREILDRNPGTVRRQWGKARTLLHRYLSEGAIDK